MRISSKRIAAVVVVAGALLALLAGTALAGPPWSDAPNSYWVSTYQVSEAQIATVADGYLDGTFRPAQAVTRGQFAKMAISGLDLPTLDRAVPTFKDVPKGNTFYVYIEAAFEEGLITGYPVTGGIEFRPGNNITRQQTNSILGRFLSEVELAATGVIRGPSGLTYPTLASWYAVWGEFYLGKPSMPVYPDMAELAEVHRAATAYLVYHGVVKGSGGKLLPTTTLTRAQAAVMVLRVYEKAREITMAPPAPTDLAVDPASPSNHTTPTVTGMTIPGGIVHIYDSVDGAAPVDLYAGVPDSLAPRADANGVFSAHLPVLGEGAHVFTAKVKNSAGLVSALSTSSVTYVLDTVDPSGTIVAPWIPTGEPDAAVNKAKPDFIVTATDERSGVAEVVFQVAKDEVSPDWLTISTDSVADTGGLYQAVWPSSGALAAGLSDGQHLFRAVIYDKAGNSRMLVPLPVTVDTVAPTAAITAPVPNSEDVFYTESAKPVFTATAADADPAEGEASQVMKVDFLYATWDGSFPTAWAGFTFLSADQAPAYGAVYDAEGLANGRYLFAVRATDRAGNTSLLLKNATDYADGVTQEVIIDDTPPVITILEPDEGELVPDGLPFEIRWTITDLTPPDTVKIEYTEDGTAADPEWVLVAAAAPTVPKNGDPFSSFSWSVPAIAADNVKFQIRVTAIDKAGPIVGNVPGHTTQQASSLFTVYVAPLGVTGLTAEDNDHTEEGVDGRDFSASWTLSATPTAHVASQNVYILPASITELDLEGSGAAIPVAALGKAQTSWTGAADLTVDSQNEGPRVALTEGSYRIWIVVTDLAGRIMAVPSALFDVTAE